MESIWTINRRYTSYSQQLVVLGSRACRKANKPAHCLAKVALGQFIEQVCIEDSPMYIQSIVLAEQEF